MPLFRLTCLMTTDDQNEKLADEWYERKSVLMEKTLGREHDIVMHAIIPYAIGGGLDLYYYPNGIPGTAIATKELSDIPGEGSKNDAFNAYELVMFTRYPIDLDSAKDKSTEFGRVHANINAILNTIAPYSSQAKLNPNETCEFPKDMPHVGGKYLIFDNYGSHSDPVIGTFGLLALIEIFPAEMKHARKHGGASLIQRLKDAGHYPYSDMNRKTVVSSWWPF